MLRRQANSVLREEWVWGEGEFYSVKKNQQKKQNPDTHSNADVPDTHAQMRKLNSAARE